MSLALLFHYLLLNMFRKLIHPSSGACDLFDELFNGLYCSDSMCVGVTLWFGWGGVVSVCRLNPEQYNTWNNSTNKSQAPEDGCINTRKMYSIKWWNNNASDIKLVSLYSTMSLYVSYSNYVHHQQSNTVHTAIHTGYADCLLASGQHNLYVLLCVQC